MIIEKGEQRYYIKGKFKKIRKGNYKCPIDGVHRRKNSGRVRSFWGAKTYEGTFIFYGNWSFYTMFSGEIGCKVCYSFKMRKYKTDNEVAVTCSVMDLLKKFCPEVDHLGYIDIDVAIDNRTYKKSMVPIMFMQHIHYPEKAWRDFAKGKPYDWGADPHPAHSIVGFKAFRAELEDFTKNIDYNFDSFSIGNIVWCTVEKRWYLVDVR